jgi:histidinol-phosphate aminotransferase
MKEIEIQSLIKPTEIENRMLDFATVRNPYGASPFVERALTLFPQINEAGLKDILTDKFRLPPASIILDGNGSTAIINRLPSILSNRQCGCLLVTPTYFGFHDALKNSGVSVSEIATRKEEGFAINENIVRKLMQVSESLSPAIIWLCTPNNPTGVLTELSDIALIAGENPNSLIVVDEAYQEIVDPDNMRSATKLITDFPNILVTKTFSKAYGLENIRLGLAFGSEALIIALASLRNPNETVNQTVLAKAATALLDYNQLRLASIMIKKDRETFLEKLSLLPDIEVASDSKINILLLRHRRGNLHQMLLNRGIKTYDFDNISGLVGMGFVRVALQTEEENDILIEALADC